MKPEKMAPRYIRRLREGACPSCGQPARPGRVMCRKCAERAAAEYRKKHPRREPKWKTDDSLYGRRRRAGLCVGCGKPAKRAMCPSCRKHKTARELARSWRKDSLEKPQQREVPDRDNYAQTARPKDAVEEHLHLMAIRLAKSRGDF